MSRLESQIRHYLAGQARLDRDPRSQVRRHIARLREQMTHTEPLPEPPGPAFPVGWKDAGRHVLPQPAKSVHEQLREMKTGSHRSLKEHLVEMERSARRPGHG